MGAVDDWAKTAQWHLERAVHCLDCAEEYRGQEVEDARRHAKAALRFTQSLLEAVAESAA